MNAHPVPADERPNITPSPPPAQIVFPPILFSPLLFQSNSPLASPHTPPSITRQNPFDLLPASLLNPQSSPPAHPVHDTSPSHDDPNDKTPPPTPHNSLNNTRNTSIETPKNDPHLDMTNNPKISPPVFNTYISASFPSSPPPTVSEDPALDICFEDDALSPLERIYLLSRSAAVYHRVYVARAMSSFLPQVLPQDVLDYVLPILSSLAIDEDETVKEALSAELVHVIWWVVTHYRVVREDGCQPLVSDETNPDVLPICVQAFTPILGTLLLSMNGNVGSNARSAIVGILRRIKRLDDIEDGVDYTQAVDKGGGTNVPADLWIEGLDDLDLTLGLFERKQRRLLEDELLRQVVIGMARLDMQEEEPQSTQGTPYFDALQPSTPYFDQTPYYDALQSPEVLLNPASTRDSYFPAVLAGAYETSGSGNARAEDSTERLKPVHPRLACNSPQPTSDDSTPELSPSGLTPSIKPTASSNGAACLDPSSDSDKTPPAPRRPDIDSIMSGVTIYEGDDWSSRHDQNWMPPKGFEESPQSPVVAYPWMSESVIFGDPAPQNKHEETLGCPITGVTSLGDYHEGVEDEEQAAMGRLSSMSLMAAVTASGPLSEEMKLAFVKEVERVAKDPIYCVRREASYTLGALAKVIPIEIVVSSLLPLLEDLCQDEVWHVRHSALFALPATLARLQPNQRRAVALRVIMPLSRDSSSNVRTAVLEALGEVLYAFHEDEDGVPPELLELFLGRMQDSGSTISCSSSRKSSNEDWSDHYPPWALESSANPREGDANGTDIWNDPTRPLICAFNYPALALTLGKERWGELRELYLELSTSLVVKVRCTLAASLGELAKILGVENTHNDLMRVFKSSITAEEGEVRLKAIEALELFVSQLGDDDRWEVVEVLLSTWNSDLLRGWREREGVVKLLSIFSGYQYDVPDRSYWRGRQLRDILLKGLEDGVASVRDTAISVVPSLFFGWRSRQQRLWGEFVQDLARMASDRKYSRRTTFVATQQGLLLHEPGAESLLEDGTLQIALEKLATDHIPGVRIGVARLVKLVCGKHLRL
ncbi:ARM repeat-containing protein [Thelephora ganbajun]|uniref:ARM repeat-containing protein n=1 Tax=Thelephora ganbajun TaxID=370292 RepID=A0ACB6ZSN0_THEGA|nr:ARM repeat-containing protein [Thelephora ganbajun]